jgi:hypothetical protein
LDEEKKDTGHRAGGKRLIKKRYRKGADFERKVLKELIGGGTTLWDIGLIQHTVLDAFVESCPKVIVDSVFNLFRVSGKRTPGSKGKCDLVVTASLVLPADKGGSHHYPTPDNPVDCTHILDQVVMGVQCKSDKERSDKKIQEELDVIRYTMGLYPLWAYGQRGKVILIPGLDELKNKVSEWPNLVFGYIPPKTITSRPPKEGPGIKEEVNG